MSIADELALLANTKESLRVAIGLSTSIPFSQYAANVPWAGSVIPVTGTVFDFQKNRYAKDGKAVYLDDVSEFIRLSSATMWQEDGGVVEVDTDVPRISGEGLLIEPQRTNYCPLWDLPEEGNYNRCNVEYDKGWKQVEGEDFGWLYPIPPTAIPTQPLITVARTGGNFTRFVLNNSPRELTAVASGAPDMYQVGYVSDFNEVEPRNQGVNWKYCTGDPIVTHLQYEEHGGTLKSSTLIPTGGTPATRAPDTLNIPLLPTQTITGDWDEGVTYEVADNIATFTGHGYIRNITVEAL